MTRFDALLDWYSTLSPDTLTRAADYYHRDARFKDPFNEVMGVGAIVTVFEHMFSTTQNPRFILHDRIMQGQQGFVTWTFEFGLNGKPYAIRGASHIKFNEQGLVILHRDYWDAAEELLQKLPLVGAPMRWLRGRFK
jgi:hypothetical protein